MMDETTGGCSGLEGVIGGGDPQRVKVVRKVHSSADMVGNMGSGAGRGRGRRMRRMRGGGGEVPMVSGGDRATGCVATNSQQRLLQWKTIEVDALKEVRDDPIRMCVQYRGSVR